MLSDLRKCSRMATVYEDPQLIEAIRAGEPEALDGVIRKYLRQIHRAARVAVVVATVARHARIRRTLHAVAELPAGAKRDRRPFAGNTRDHRAKRRCNASPPTTVSPLGVLASMIQYASMDPV